MRALALAGVALFAGCSGPGPQRAPDGVRFDGRVWSVEDIGGPAGPRPVRVHEPYEDREVVFRAVPAEVVLDRALGRRWRTRDELEFECRDGYRESVPVARFLTHRAHFAVAREDREAFTLDEPVGDAVVETELGPVYLIWENLRDALVRAEGDWGWPYQVVAVEPIVAAERYAPMAPPPDASPEATRGFAAFRRWCARCHAIDGVGGRVGPELNAPVSVTTTLRPPWLRRWIGAPATVRHGTTMPGLPTGIADRDRTLDDLVAYLRAVAPPVREP